MSAKAADILVVEDDEGVREAVVDVLADAGYSVATANDGLEALDWLNKTSQLPSLILLDVMMPRMDGEQFLNVAKKDERLASLPVVLMTANLAAPKRLEPLGAAGILRKPTALAELIDLASRFCPPPT